MNPDVNCQYYIEWRNEDRNSGVVRAYEEYGNPNYWGVATVWRRPNGLHEPLAWLTKEGSHIHYHADVISFLMDQGLRIAWTFEVDKFELYERALRESGELKILDTFSKEYNGVVMRFHYGEIIPRE